MATRYRGGAPRVRGTPMSPVRPSRQVRDYKSLSTSVRRHEFTTGTPRKGSASTLPANDYFLAEIIRFKRTFTGVADTEPTATASNNFQSTSVMNGSSIRNLDVTIELKNTSATQVATLDVYAVELSFYDALIWDTVRTANSPVSFNTVAPNQGEIDAKTSAATIILENDWHNFKFQQHYLKKIGTITMGNGDGDNTAILKFTRVPPKCRRSQTGMFYGIFFSNPSEKNGAAILNLDYSMSISFDEYPSENRLPYVN